MILKIDSTTVYYFFQEIGLDFSTNEVDNAGVNLVHTLQECLWYIDGRHAII